MIVLIPDLSRMESEIRDRGERKKVTTKGKGIRGSSKSGGQFLSLIENVDAFFVWFRIYKFLEAMRQATGFA